MAGAQYCCDADVLIEISRHFPDGVRRLSKAVKKGLIVLPEAVHKELRKKSDPLKAASDRWKEKHAAVIQYDANPELKRELARIERTYGEEIKIGESSRPGFWKSKKGQKAADGQVVTVSKVMKITAVSDDRAVKDACYLENVPCIGWQEFWRRIGQGTTDNPSFEFE
jgi:rRNA-processing protein FCF1